LSSTADLTFQPLLGDPRSLADFLGRPGVLRTGHFRLLSGLHAEHFLAFSAIAQDSDAVREIAADLAAVCGPWRATVVLAPSTAGVALGGEIARALELPLHLASLDADGRADGILGDADLSGQRVLVVNDVVTTGDGLAALGDVVVASGGAVAGAACFGTRSDVDVADRLGVGFCVSAALDLPAVPAANCGLCSAGVELEDALDIN
jgi:orotate phosphoribosyltransferase